MKAGVDVNYLDTEAILTKGYLNSDEFRAIRNSGQFISPIPIVKPEEIVEIISLLLNGCDCYKYRLSVPYRHLYVSSSDIPKQLFTIIDAARHDFQIDQHSMNYHHGMAINYVMCHEKELHYFNDCQAYRLKDDWRLKSQPVKYWIEAAYDEWVENDMKIKILKEERCRIDATSTGFIYHGYDHVNNRLRINHYAEQPRWLDRTGGKI